MRSGGRRQAGGELFPRGEDRRLPWLEPEEDEDSGATGFDTGRALTVILAALALLAALAAGVWWLAGAHGGEAAVADGSIIEAPEGPYKVRPADPGGTRVAGTGNVSFAVGEGEEREGRIAGNAAGEAEDGVGVQIGAFPSEEDARTAWGAMGVRIPALSGRSYRILESSADAGAVFLLQALAASEDDAEALCAAIREDGGDCQVKD